MATKQQLNSKALVSVLIPTYGMGAFIGEALRSVREQSHTNWQLIVVDDVGPKDGTDAIMAAFIHEVGGDKVQYLHHATNQGVSAARNTALAAANGTFVAFLDPDDFWFPDHLESALALFEQDAEVSAVSGPVEIFEKEEKGRVRPMEDWQIKLFPHSLALYNFIQPSATVVRAASIQALGGFNTDPRMQHIEDYDLWIRLVENGARFAFLQHATSRYRRHEGGATSAVAVMRKLDDHLVSQYPGFFRRANAHMTNWLMITTWDMREAAIRHRIETNGPIMRVVKWCDRMLRRSISWIRKSA